MIYIIIYWYIPIKWKTFPAFEHTSKSWELRMNDSYTKALESLDGHQSLIHYCSFNLEF